MPGNPFTTSGKTAFDRAEVEFEITEDASEILIGLYTAIGVRFDSDLAPSEIGAWFKADNFDLTLLSKSSEVEWTMGNGVYDTLILPFDSEIPEGMAVFISEKTDDSIESDYYQVLELLQVDKIEANTPYVVRKIEESEPVTRSASVKVSGNNFTFTGSATNDPDQDTYTTGLLTGTLGGRTIDDGDYVMTDEEGKHFFTRYEQNVEGIAVPANHAYIANETVSDHKPILFLEQYEDLGDLETGIKDILSSSETIVDVYSSEGTLIRRKVEIRRALEGLGKGIYILTDGKRSLKAIR